MKKLWMIIVLFMVSYPIIQATPDPMIVVSYDKLTLEEVTSKVISVTAEQFNISEDSINTDTLIEDITTESEAIANWYLKMEQSFGFSLDIEWFDSNNSLGQLSGALFVVQP